MQPCAQRFPLGLCVSPLCAHKSSHFSLWGCVHLAGEAMTAEKPWCQAVAGGQGSFWGTSEPPPARSTPHFPRLQHFVSGCETQVPREGDKSPCTNRAQRGAGDSVAHRLRASSLLPAQPWPRGTPANGFSSSFFHGGFCNVSRQRGGFYSGDHPAASRGTEEPLLCRRPRRAVGWRKFGSLVKAGKGSWQVSSVRAKNSPVRTL